MSCAGSKNCGGPVPRSARDGPTQFFDPAQGILIPTLFPTEGVSFKAASWARTPLNTSPPAKNKCSHLSKLLAVPLARNWWKMYQFLRDLKKKIEENFPFRLCGSTQCAELRVCHLATPLSNYVPKYHLHIL